MTSLSSQERTVIQTLLELNYSVRAIARFIKRSPSTVSIEIHQVTPYKAQVTPFYVNMVDCKIKPNT
ncbi:hypothetical protein BMS84_09750 [Leuconostoc pseudomesenteroides]|nr:hypothetical protein BMS84_09750 [Leuconostoc pseudomesenteroides]